MRRLLFVLLIVLEASCTNNIDNPSVESVDSHIDNLMEEFDIPGVGLAIVSNGALIHKKCYGYADLDQKIPVSTQTLFQLFSTTKIFTSTAIHQLIQQDKIGLNDNISKHLNDLPESWNDVQIDNLLSHSSGLPNIVRYLEDEESIAAAKAYKDTIQYPSGKRYSYNQTNFWLLDRITKKITGSSLPEFVVEEQFSKNSQGTIFEGSSHDMTKGRATNYYGYSGEDTLKLDEYNIPEYLISASGQNISLSAFLDWNEKFDRNEFLDDNSKSRLFKKYDFEEPANHAHGWRIRELNNFESFGFKAGSFTVFRKFPSRGLTVILLTNGCGKGYDIEQTVDHIAGLVDAELSVSNNAGSD